MANGNEDIGILENLPDTQEATVPRGTPPEVGTDKDTSALLSNLPDREGADPNAVLGLRGAPSELDMDSTHRNFLAFGIDPSVYNNVKADFDHQAKLHPQGVSILNITDLKLNARVDQHAADPSIPSIRQGQPLTKWQKTRVWFEDQFGITAKRQLEFEAQREGLSPEELADRVGANNVRLDRYLKFDPAAGAAGVLEGVAGGLEWLTDGEIGGDFANQMQILSEEMSPVDPNFLDQVSQGAGSMAMFFIPGLGVGSGVTRIFATAPRVANILGASTMTGLEAMTEAGLVWRDVFRKTSDQKQADKAANATFWLNVPLLFVTNKLGIFAEGGNSLNRFLRSAALEGTQEAGQEIISASQTGEEVKFKDLATAFGVGAIIGGGAGSITGALQDVQVEGVEPLTVPPTPLEVAPEQAELTTPDIPAASEAVRQGKEPSIAESATETAEIAQDTSINEAVERVVQTSPEEMQTLMESDLTDEQIVEQLTKEPTLTERLIDPLRGEEGAVTIGRALVADEIQTLEEAAEADILALTQPEITRGAEEGPEGLRIEEQVGARALQQPEPTEATKAADTQRRIEQRAREEAQRKPAISLVELLRTDPIARQREIDTGISLLTEQGHINLQAEVALDVIRDRLGNFTQDPRQGIQDVLNIGRAVFAEGKAQVQDFTTRMQEIAGDAWETIKPYIQRAWEILNNERGAIGRPEQTDTPEFERFFKDSKVVDEEGNPAIVFHGTDAPAIKKFESVEGEFFFTDKIEVAQEFGSRQERVFLSLQNPHIVDFKGEKTGKDVFDEIDFAKENNFDGVIAQNVSEGAGLPLHQQIVAFSPAQIRLAEPSVEISLPEGAPEFDIDNRIQAIRTQARSKELPAFMEDNPTWSEAEVDTALDKAQQGKQITEREAEIVHVALAEAGANFYQEAIEDEFITLEPDEVDQIVQSGIQEFVSKLEVVKAVELTAEQKKKKERTQEFARRGKEIKTLQDALRLEAMLLHQSVQDQASIRQEAKLDTKAAKETVKRLESKIATRDKRIDELREKAKGAARALPKPTVKAQIRQATGQVRAEAPLVREDVAFKESMRQAVKAARVAFKEGRSEGVQTELERINTLQETKQARQRKSAARAKLAKRLKALKKSKKQNIAVDYQRRINELIDTIDLKGRPTAKTLDRLVSLREWLQTHQDKLEVPQERIDQLKRLEKLSLAEMTDEEVKEIQDTVNTLVQLGKLKRGLKVKYDKQERQKVLDELIASTNNVDPKKFDPDEPTKLQNFDRGIRQAYMNTLHSPRVADMVDGFQHFDGPNAALIKDFSRGESIAKLNTKAIVSEAMETIIEETGISEMTEDQQTRIMIHIRLREGAFDQVKTLMEKNDMTEIPELSEQESRLIEVIQGATGQFTDQIAATVEEVDNVPFNRLEGYVLPIKYEKEFNIAGPEMINQTRHRTTRPIQGFKFERVKGVKRTPRTDVFGIFEEAISEQQWYLNMQPRLEHARQLVLTEEYAEAAGDLMTNWWAEQLDQVARRGWSAKAQAQPALRQVRLNLNQAILGYKLSSTLIQPFAIFDAMAYMTNKYGLASSQDIIKEFAKAWVNPKYAESIIQDSQALPNRRAGEIAVEEVLDKLGEAKTLRQKFIKSGLSLLQEADIRTAAGVRQGILKALEKRGVENAKDEADFLMNMVSGSSEVSLRPQVLGQGELARTYFTFQSFMLNRWGIIANDIIAGGLLKKGQTWKGRYNSIMALAIFIAAGASEDEAREFIFELTTGKELPDENAVASAMLSLVSNIPVLGNLIEGAIRRRPTGPPAVRTFEQGVGGIRTAFTGKTSETRLRGVLRATESALAITAGIPGTAQGFDFAERLMIPEKRR